MQWPRLVKKIAEPRSDGIPDLPCSPQHSVQHRLSAAATKPLLTPVPQPARVWDPCAHEPSPSPCFRCTHLPKPTQDRPNLMSTRELLHPPLRSGSSSLTRGPSMCLPIASLTSFTDPNTTSQPAVLWHHVKFRSLIQRCSSSTHFRATRIRDSYQPLGSGTPTSH
jgi:hypothetical protein